MKIERRKLGLILMALPIILGMGDNFILIFSMEEV
jgi:hypothetical protein